MPLPIQMPNAERFTANGVGWLVAAVSCLVIVPTPSRAQPPTETTVATRCEENDSQAARRLLTGIVRDDDSGEGLEGALVVAVTDNEELSSIANSTGSYAICGVPPNASIELFAEYDGNVSNSVTLRFVDGGVHRTIRDSNSAQSAYRPMAGNTWVEDFQIAQVPVVYASPPASVGFKSGLTSSTVSGDGLNAESIGGFLGGLFYEDYGQYLGWRVEGAYVRQGAYSPIDGQEMTLHYLRLPVLAAVRTSRDESRFLTPFLLAGPAFGFDTRGQRGVPKGDISLMFGGGVRVNAGAVSIVADATYGLGMTSNAPPVVSESPEFATQASQFFRGTDFRNRVLSVSLGLSFRMRPGMVGFGGTSVRSGRPPARDIISREEVDATDVTTAYELVQRLHPQWLRSRGQVTMSGAGAEQPDPAAIGPVVYLDRSRRGDVEQLRSISVQTIAEVIYFNGRDASFSFGAGHGGGVIQVITR